MLCITPVDSTAAKLGISKIDVPPHHLLGDKYIELQAWRQTVDIDHYDLIVIYKRDQSISQ